MSTAQTQRRGPSRPPIQELPPKICLGTVNPSLEDAKLSQSGSYYVQKLHLRGRNGSPDGYDILLFKPEWFSSGFDIQTYFDARDEAEQEHGKESPEYRAANAPIFVYSSNIVDSRRGSVSKLQGIAGSDERFDQLWDALVTDEAEADPAQITATLREFLRENETETVGFVLTQKKDGGELTDRYEVRQYFRTDDEKTVRYWLDRRGAVLAFDPDLPF